MYALRVRLSEACLYNHLYRSELTSWLMDPTTTTLPPAADDDVSSCVMASKR